MNKDLPELPKLVKPTPLPTSYDKQKKARPWDLFNKNIERVPSDIKSQRLNMCKACPELIKLTTQCKKCGCFMDAKTELPHAECPLGKWGRVNIDPNSVSYKE
jgi:hypothetical protein